MSNGLPSGWELKKLGEVGGFSKGKGIAKKDTVSIGLPCIRYAEIYTNYDFVIKKFKSFITPALAKNSKKMIKNDIVFAGSGETVEDIGKSVAFVDNFDAYVGGDSIVLSPLIQIDSSFMSYQLNDSIRRIQLRKLGQGSSVIHIYSSGLSELVVHLPPLPEQKKIAKILSSVDEVIKTTETQINKLKDLKKGMMNELLTKGIGHTEFKDSPVGRVPVGWEVKYLDEVLTKIEGGGTPARNIAEYWGDEISWATVKDLTGIFLTKTEEKITYKGLNASSSKLIPAFTIIIATRMAVGKAVVFNCDVAINQDLKAIYPSDQLNWKYLLQWFILKSDDLESMGTGSTVKGIRLEDLKIIQILLPPLQEQQKIASILGSIDTNIEQKQTKLTQSKNLKKSLMADLLTGRVRVKPDKE